MTRTFVRMSGIGILLFAALWLVFGNRQPATAPGSVSASSIQSDFPVPADARPVPGHAQNPQIKSYAKYGYAASDEIGGIPEWYQKAIRDWGWSERKEEQMGAFHVFRKEDKTVWLTWHDGFFTLSVLK